ncbi:MAG: 2-amino-4-hydroxy-6-hydroxymethyldihydropteridine diphosphokinase [Thermodesulfobacteriota bacterium]
MTEAFIGLGSNLGDGQANLLAAWQRLGEVPGVTLGSLSRPYRTAPVGMETTHWFTNAVGGIHTELPPDKLLGVLLAIELELGRDRAQGRDRTVDLDLLLYGREAIALPGCVVPHPELARRLFVLAPLAELAPDMVPPQLGRTIRELCREVEQSGQVVERDAWRIEGYRCIH